MRLTRLAPSAAIAAVPFLLLAACQEEAVVPQGDDGREASGEVLPASVSDDMIATDRLRSQPPLMVDVPDAPAAGSDADGEDAGEDAADETPADIPAAPPAPEPAVPTLDLPPPVLDLPPE